MTLRQQLEAKDRRIADLEEHIRKMRIATAKALDVSQACADATLADLMRRVGPEEVCGERNEAIGLSGVSCKRAKGHEGDHWSERRQWRQQQAALSPRCLATKPTEPGDELGIYYCQQPSGHLGEHVSGFGSVRW